jgi:hypothetical protein
MKDPLKLLTTAPEPSGSAAWDGEPDEILLGRRERISQELRQLLLAACRAATMDGFLLAAAVIPAKADKDGYASIDDSRRASAFSNLDDASDPSSLLLWAGERLKRRQ